MKLIVGLGNPGPQYEWNRHNLGFMVIDALASEQKARWRGFTGYQGKMAKAAIGGVECSLLKPWLLFMNNSGVSVKKMSQSSGLEPKDILVVCDDLDLSFGKLRLRPSGSAGGHNGLKSIIEHLGTDQFARLRMGIDEPKAQADTADYVLANFTAAEKKALPDFINHALDCVTCWVTEGATAAMNKFN